MISRIIITASAVFLIVLGIGLDFLPQEVAASLGLGNAPVAAVVLQVMAAAFFGMGFMNWLSKGNPMGGIYSRPLALQNFLSFGVGAVTLGRAVLHGAVPQGIQAAAIAFTTFALAFGWLLFFHDPVAAAQKKQLLP